MRLAAVVCAGTVLALTAGAATAGPRVELTATAGPITATVSYVQSRSRPSTTDVRLRIVRQGAVALEERIGELTCRDCNVWRPGIGAQIAAIRARDLDRDGEPEVLLDVFTGGAHCCSLTAVHHREAGGAYRRTVLDFGNAGYRLTDLDRDGRPELRSSDDRFSYAFAPYAYSMRPVQIWHWQAGRALDATRRHPAAVRADARALFRAYEQARRRRDAVAVRGTLAAWAADLHLLGRGAEAWRRLEAARRAGELGVGPRDGLHFPAGRRYLAELRVFLRRTGYAG